MDDSRYEELKRKGRVQVIRLLARYETKETYGHLTDEQAIQRLLRYESGERPRQACPECGMTIKQVVTVTDSLWIVLHVDPTAAPCEVGPFC